MVVPPEFPVEVAKTDKFATTLNATMFALPILVLLLVQLELAVSSTPNVEALLIVVVAMVEFATATNAFVVWN